MDQIRDAATIVLVRSEKKNTLILMGKRSSTAAFMPSKYVFPGGSWEEMDNEAPIAKPLSEKDRLLLELSTSKIFRANLAVTAVRELWEETGLRLSSPTDVESFSSEWKNFCQSQCAPDLSNLKFFFRAITPPGRSRRFDARFFLCDAVHISNDLDDFTEASSELSELRWVDVNKTDILELPTITKIVVNYIKHLLASDFQFDEIPFYSGGSGGMESKKLKLKLS